jgi:PBP superfamily domain
MQAKRNNRSPNTRSSSRCHLGRTSRADYLLRHNLTRSLSRVSWKVTAEAGIAPASVTGPEAASHLEVALSVASGQADTGLGVRAAATAPSASVSSQ